MALAVSIRFDMRDDKGKTSFTKVRVPTGFSIADYVEFGQAMGQLVATIDAASITRAGVVFNVDISGLGLKSVAGGVSKVARKLYLQFTTAVTGFIGKTLFPALDEAKVIAGSDDVDDTDTEVAALVTAFEDGIVVTAGTMTMTNGRGHDLVALSDAKEQFRRRKSG